MNRRTVVVLGEGGTICSEYQGTETPSKLSSRTMYNMIGSFSSRVSEGLKEVKRELGETRKMVTSDAVTAERLVDFAEKIREQVMQLGNSVIALVPTRKAARYAAMGAAAIPPEALRSEGSGDPGRTVLFAASKYPMRYPGGDAEKSVRQAIKLASLPHMAGKAALVFDGVAYPLARADENTKTGELAEVVSLNRHIGQARDGAWLIAAHDAQTHIPFGDSERDFTMVDGVKTLVIRDHGAGERDDHPSVAKILEEHFAEATGMVVKTYAGQNPFIDGNADDLRKAAERGLPTWAVWTQNDRNGVNSALSDVSDFEESYPNIILGNGELPSGSAKVFLAHWLSEARIFGYTTTEDAVDYVRGRIAAVGPRIGISSS